MFAPHVFPQILMTFKKKYQASESQLMEIVIFAQMKNLVDTLATAERHLTATEIWMRVWNDVTSRYSGTPIRSMKKHEVISRVQYIRNGGRRVDSMRDIEEREMALFPDERAPFLAFNTPVYEGILQHRITGWGHPGLYKLLKSPNVHIFIDGTFRIVPNPYSQLLVVMIRDYPTDLYLPVFYILMTGKSAFLYRFALNMINNIVGTSVRPGQIYCDFEKALISALRGNRHQREIKLTFISNVCSRCDGTKCFCYRLPFPLEAGNPSQACQVEIE